MREKSYFFTDPVCLIHTRCFDPGYINYLNNLNHSVVTFHTYRTLNPHSFPSRLLISLSPSPSRTVEVLGSHSCPSGGGASIEEVGGGGGGLKRNYDDDMGSFRVLSNGGLVMVVVQGTGRRLGFHHHKTLGKSSDL
ncbi:hypothetical protein HanHA89_Chr04g0158361 [Helianthus annuus]|nr:hypothetical protein HanHA89_Chr04g0158361 [Helianthus annuus]